MSYIRINNVTKVYKDENNYYLALKNINLEFNNLGLSVILGPSGCGKTSLLNIISGEDVEFEGQRINVLKISYLTQEVQLFESMSVYENLKIVKNDNETIDNYLKKYGMWEHRNKKVKKCSSGQKKRVQFLRSLLQTPTILLCDEPTAALDHENKELLMNDLKEVSKDIQVIVVTHDIALAEKYADRIIRMGKGFVESDDVINKTGEIRDKGKQKKKSFKETIQLLWYELKSRIAENLLFLLLLVLGIISIFSTVDLYETIEQQTDILNSYKNGTNISYSYPKKPMPQNGMVKSDIFYYQDIINIVNNHPEIIAVEAFYDDVDAYQNTDSQVYTRYMNEIFNEYDYPIFLEKYKYDSYKNNYIVPFKNMFFINDEKISYYKKYVDRVRTERIYEPFRVSMDDGKSTIEDYEFSFFDIVDINEITLIYGSIPQTNNEIIIAKNTADMLLKYYGVEDYESLIGKTVTASMYTKNELLLCEETYDYFYDDKEATVKPMIDLIVKGITNIENDKIKMVFFNTEFGQNAITKYYVKNYEHLYFEYIRFIVKPGTDMEIFTNEMNESFSCLHSYFKTFIAGTDAEIIYRNKDNMNIFKNIIIAIFVSIITIFYLFKRSRMIKEMRLMKEYGYNAIFEKILNVFVMNTIALLVVLLFGNQICNLINGFAKLMSYAKFLSFEFKYIFIGYLVIMLFNLLCEILICRKR